MTRHPILNPALLHELLVYIIQRTNNNSRQSSEIDMDEHSWLKGNSLLVEVLSCLLDKWVKLTIGGKGFSLGMALSFSTSGFIDMPSLYLLSKFSTGKWPKRDAITYPFWSCLGSKLMWKVERKLLHSVNRPDSFPIWRIFFSGYSL